VLHQVGLTDRTNVRHFYHTDDFIKLMNYWCYCIALKPDAAAAADRLLMIGIRMPETCRAVFKRPAINL
jgi:hypothetical protein